MIQKIMVKISVGLSPENDCDGKSKKKLYKYITGTSSRQRGRLIIRNSQI
jgi:hypothetical protein